MQKHDICVNELYPNLRSALVEEENGSSHHLSDC